jgi:hypothetical protein
LKLLETRFLPATIDAATVMSDSANCAAQPLGMEQGHIEDHMVSASSAFDNKSVGPHNGRWVILEIIIYLYIYKDDDAVGHKKLVTN